MKGDIIVKYLTGNRLLVLSAPTLTHIEGWVMIDKSIKALTHYGYTIIVEPMDDVVSVPPSHILDEVGDNYKISAGK